MKRVIITGAAGFLGSHLAKHHLDVGDHVLGIDDFSSSTSTSKHYLELKKRQNFDFLINDISCIQPQVLDKWPANLIYNFACPASPPRYQEMPIHTMLTCVNGTQRMLQHAENCDAVFVQASTSEVYGDPDRSPQQESYRGIVNSYGPRACYDEGKRAAEALCWDYHNRYDLDARLVRIFNTYGPNMDPYDGRVVSNFIVQALKNKPLTVYGNGEQTRSFCYVDDLIRGIVALGELKHNPGGPINIGNPNEFTIATLASLVAEKLLPKFSIDAHKLGQRAVYEDLPADDPMQRCPDITKAKQLLNWEPQVQLSEGLDKTIEYFKSVI